MENSNQSNNNNNLDNDDIEYIDCLNWWDEHHAKRCFIEAICLVEEALGKHLLKSYLEELEQLRFIFMKEINEHMSSIMPHFTSTFTSTTTSTTTASNSNNNAAISTSSSVFAVIKKFKPWKSKSKIGSPSNFEREKSRVDHEYEYKHCVKFWSLLNWESYGYRVLHTDIGSASGEDAKTCNGVTIDKMGHVGTYPPPKYKQMNIKIRHAHTPLLHTCVHELIHWLCFPTFEKELFDAHLRGRFSKEFVKTILLEGVTEYFTRYCLRGTPEIAERQAYQTGYDFICAMYGMSEMPEDFNKLCVAYFQGNVEECKALMENAGVFSGTAAQQMKSEKKTKQAVDIKIHEHDHVVLTNGTQVPLLYVKGILDQLERRGVSDIFEAGRRMGIPASVLAKLGYKGG